jgi:NAD(P)-dependent dehydrogenase (short-subunit alcohol dehydrogenase family)
MTNVEEHDIMATKTVLITGSNSGIGSETVKAFANAGWNVAATMRNTANDGALSKLPRVRVYRLDVTDAESVSSAFRDVIKDHGHIDVVVNNAGYGLVGVFESMTDDVLQRQFETNVIGLMRVTRAAISHMRERRSGTIVQVSSMGGRITFPLYAPYHATKWAVEGFTESLQWELEQVGIRVKLVEPGLIKTDFAGRSSEMSFLPSPNPYESFIAKFNTAATKALADAVEPAIVAAAILKAATDTSSTLRYPVGNPAPMLLRLRKLLSDSMFFSIIRKAYKL